MIKHLPNGAEYQGTENKTPSMLRHHLANFHFSVSVKNSEDALVQT
jgi:hypothetical protein